MFEITQEALQLVYQIHFCLYFRIRHLQWVIYLPLYMQMWWIRSIRKLSLHRLNTFDCVILYLLFVFN